MQQRKQGRPAGFSTVHPDATADLHALAAWLQSLGITTVAMESTGVYWIPLFEVLEARGLEVRLVNARAVKHVPGRKTDVQDAQWLQQLHQYGLLRGSFRPREQIVRLRAYVRERERLIATAASHIQHMHKALTQRKRVASLRGSFFHADSALRLHGWAEAKRPPLHAHEALPAGRSKRSRC